MIYYYRSIFKEYSNDQYILSIFQNSSTKKTLCKNDQYILTI